jgi:murein DD-endopeptidase MepM/ murein hydrolase activator NlpD
VTERLTTSRTHPGRWGLFLVALTLAALATTGPFGPSARAGVTPPPGPTVPTTSTTVPTSTTVVPTTTTLPGPTSTTVVVTDPLVPPPEPEIFDFFADELVEPGGGYADQGAFDPNSNAVVESELRRAQAELRDATRQGQQALADVAAARDRLAGLDAQLVGRAEADPDLLRASEAAHTLFVQRAADAYVRGNDSDLSLLFASEDANDYGKRAVLLESVLEADDEVFDTYVATRAELGGELVGLHDELVAASRDLKTARVVEKELRAEIVDLTIEVRMWEAGSQLMAHGFLFPVAGEVTFGDSWGAPRMPGTQYAHWHEGTDIMAAAGTPLVASEHGVISRTSSSTLGGISVYLRGESGIEYYYAHLSSYAPETQAGLRVRAGDVLGFVGDTGNAKGGSPHLHFEIHGLDGRAVNPYPMLKIAHETQAIFAAITVAGG